MHLITLQRKIEQRNRRSRKHYLSDIMGIVSVGETLTGNLGLHMVFPDSLARAKRGELDPFVCWGATPTVSLPRMTGFWFGAPLRSLNAQAAIDLLDYLLNNDFPYTWTGNARSPSALNLKRVLTIDRVAAQKQSSIFWLNRQKDTVLLSSHVRTPSALTPLLLWYGRHGAQPLDASSFSTRECPESMRDYIVVCEEPTLYSYGLLAQYLSSEDILRTAEYTLVTLRGIQKVFEAHNSITQAQVIEGVRRLVDYAYTRSVLMSTRTLVEAIILLMHQEKLAERGAETIFSSVLDDERFVKPVVTQ